MTKEYLLLKDKALSFDVPWFYHETTVKDQKYNFPFYSHVIQTRSKNPEDPVVSNSPLFDISTTVVKQILEYNNISCSKIYRINLNATHSNFTTSSPHVDHFFPHQVLLIYLSENSGGETLVFNERYPKFFNQYDKITLDKIYPSVQNSVITFDGLKYHCHTSPVIGKQRVVLVATYDTT